MNPLNIMDEYTCHQHEADTRLFYHASLLDERNYIHTIVVDSEDTDVLVIASYASQNLTSKLCVYRRGKILIASELFPASILNIVVSFHAITGADAVSGFYRQSKKSILKRLMKSPEEATSFLESIGRVNSNVEIDESSAERFIIKFVYNDDKNTQLHTARAMKWRKMKNKCTARLPPDKDSFMHHVH